MKNEEGYGLVGRGVGGGVHGASVVGADVPGGPRTRWRPRGRNETDFAFSKNYVTLVQKVRWFYGKPNLTLSTA